MVESLTVGTETETDELEVADSNEGCVRDSNDVGVFGTSMLIVGAIDMDIGDECAGVCEFACEGDKVKSGRERG